MPVTQSCVSLAANQATDMSFMSPLFWSFNRSLTLRMTGFAMNHNQSRPKVFDFRDDVSCKLSTIVTLKYCRSINKGDDIYWSFLYSAVLRCWADSLRSHVILHEWIAFYSAFLNIHRSGVLTALAWLLPHESAAVSARSVYTIQPCTMSLHAKPHT